MTRPSPVHPIAAAFVEPERIAGIEPLPGGHIHRSYRVRVCGEDAGGDLLLQWINTRVFRDPDAMMRNILRVTRHVRSSLAQQGADDLDRRVLCPAATRDGRWLHRSADGSCWRAYRFVPDACPRRPPIRHETARQVARQFGLFQRLLLDLPDPPLEVTIPHFHETPWYLDRLFDAARRDPCGRVAGVRAELDAIERHRDLAQRFARHVEAGLRRRVAHNDAKLANVLFDARDGSALCVVDLDTVMTTFGPLDFGDLVRSMGCDAPEDERDLSIVCVTAERFEAIAAGFVEGLGPTLDAAERDALVDAAITVTFEQAVRFLCDHIEGDVYYRVARAGHNLDRARNQLALLAGLLEAEPLLHETVARVTAGPSSPEGEREA